MYSIYYINMYSHSHFHAAAGLSTFLRRRALLFSPADKRHKREQTDHNTSAWVLYYRPTHTPPAASESQFQAYN